MEIFVAKSGTETGPFTEAQIKPMLDSGMLDLKDSVWHKELTEWIPVYQFLGVRPPMPNAAEASKTTHVAEPVSVKPKLRSGDPAPFGRRLCAHLIDLMACSTLTLLFGVIVIIVIGGTLGKTGLFDSSSAPIMTIGVFIMVAGYVAVLVVPSWLYHSLWESSARQASIGKLACGLVVTDIEGNRLTFSRASKRSMGKASSQVLGAFGLIFLTCLWSSRRQCLHDIRAQCVVVVK